MSTRKNRTTKKTAAKQNVVEQAAVQQEVPPIRVIPEVGDDYDASQFAGEETVDTQTEEGTMSEKKAVTQEVARTHAITCKGVLGGLTGDARVALEKLAGKKLAGVFAEGHQEVRLVKLQDAFQVKRCEACQAEYGKISRRRGAVKRSANKKAAARQRQADSAKHTLDSMREKLSQDQIASLEAVIASASEAK